MHRCFTPALSLLAALFAPLGLCWAQTVPANFSQTTYKGGMSQITAMAWAKDGADDLLFVSQKTGQIRVITNGNLQAANVATVAVTTNNEAGLDNVIVDPNYSSNKFIYVFACQDIGGSQFRHRIYRFTITKGADVTGGSQTQIGPETPCRNVNHNGGGMAIGADNHLYWGTGNLANGSNVGDDGTAGEWTSLACKIVRVNLANPGTPPADNPWIGMSDPNIKWAFAKGLRNPFGLRIRPGTNQLWLTEVGDNYEQIFIVTSGSTQGWPTENNTTDNSKLKPILAYATNNHPYGGCLTRGNFYTGSMFPAGYMGNFFFVDYNSGKVMRGVVNGTFNGFTSTAEFVSGNSNLVDVNTGPDGALYYASNGGNIYRLAYTGAAQSLVVSTSTLTINEGGSGTFQVHLAVQPPGNVTVTTSRTSGDTDITVSGGGTLTFTTANWATNQTVTISAAEDADTTNDTAVITVASAGLTSQNVSLTAIDNDTVNGAPTATLVSPTNGQVVSGTNADFFGNATDPQGSATLARAEFYVDGVLKYTDPYVAATGHFHYGSTHLGWNTTALSDGPHTLRMTVFDTGGLSGSAQITVTVDNSSGAGGLRGDYYSGMNFDTFVMSRIDPQVNYDWGTGSPDTSIPADGFSVRWTGVITPAFSETYTFYTRSDDGSRLWVNGQQLVNQWINQGPTEWSGMIALTAGVPAAVTFEYYENGGGALAQLSWSSASQAKGTIPNTAIGTSFASGPPAPPGGGGVMPSTSKGKGGGGCGLTGLDAVLLLALARLRRRKR